MAVAIILIILLSIALSIAMLFILREQRRLVTRETTNALTTEYEAKIDNLVESQEVLISQIQPHFIYNVLNTIKYLCKRNPDEALVAIDRFSAFLRQSMDTFGTKEPIPFEEELEIVENYVYLEKCRFGDKVEVVYELEDTGFKVPPLSVQPMVENAIKHGITKNIGGGRVDIKTYEDESGHNIEIRDNGVGFYTNAPEANDGKSHIGIKNTRRRIETMCRGTLYVESAVGSMTRVLITIPKESLDER